MYPTIESIIGEIGKGPGVLIPVLQRAQEAFSYLSEERLKTISELLEIPLSDVFGVVTFYAQFRLKPMGRHTIKVCHGTACHVGGSEGISDSLIDELNIGHGETTSDGKFTLERVACLGCCSLAPCIMIDNETYGRLNPERAREIVNSFD